MTHLPTPIKKKKEDLLAICNHSTHFNIFTDSRATETFFPHCKPFSKDTGLKNLRSRFFLNWLLYQIQYFQSFIITEEDLFTSYGSLQRLLFTYWRRPSHSQHWPPTPTPPWSTHSFKGHDFVPGQQQNPLLLLILGLSSMAPKKQPT